MQAIRLLLLSSGIAHGYQKGFFFPHMFVVLVCGTGVQSEVLSAKHMSKYRVCKASLAVMTRNAAVDNMWSLSQLP